jgi:hypothetical protein
VRRGYKVLRNKPKSVCKKTNRSFEIAYNALKQVFSCLLSLKPSFFFGTSFFKQIKTTEAINSEKKKTLRSLNSNDLLRNLFRASDLSQPLVII